MPARTARPSRVVARLPAALRRALRETFGFERLRPGQDEAIPVSYTHLTLPTILLV